MSEEAETAFEDSQEGDNSGRPALPAAVFVTGEQQRAPDNSMTELRFRSIEAQEQSKVR